MSIRTSTLPLFGFLSLAAALASVTTASPARAENDDGLEILLRPGYGAAGGGSPIVYAPDGARLSTDPGKIYGNTASPWGGGFSGDASLGFRFSRFASAGIAGGFRSSSASAVDDGSTNLARSAFSVGPYLHGYAPTVLGFEPWLGVGVEYMQDVQTFDRPVSNIPATWRLTHHGVAVPITLGADYRFLEVFAIGPSFRYTPVIAAGGCAKAEAQVAGLVSTSLCSDASPKVTAANGYAAWSLGLDLRVTLF